MKLPGGVARAQQASKLVACGRGFRGGGGGGEAAGAREEGESRGVVGAWGERKFGNGLCFEGP